MNYQKGDAWITVGEQVYHLRLTLAALAAISEQLSAPTPAALSMRLRSLTAGHARVLLTCCCLSPLQASSGSAAATRPELISEAQMIDILPDLCGLFETAFASEGG